MGCATWRSKRARRACLTTRETRWRKNVRKLKRENACFRSDTKANFISNVRLWDMTLLGVLRATKQSLWRKQAKKSRAMRTYGASVTVEEAGERAAKGVDGSKVHPCNQRPL